MTSPDEPVIGNHRSCNTTEQDTISTEVVGEGGRRSVEQPGVHTDTHDGGNVSTSSDVDVSGEKSGQVTSSRDRVGSDVEEQLNIDEASTDLSGSARLQQEDGRERNQGGSTGGRDLRRRVPLESWEMGRHLAFGP